MTLNPLAQAFSMTEFQELSTILKPSKTSTTLQELSMSQLHHLSTSVAESVLVESPLLIPKITNYRRLEHIVISHSFGIFWDGTHAILDLPHASWMLPDMPIRHILQQFLLPFTSLDSLDVLVSLSPTIQI